MNESQGPPRISGTDSLFGSRVTGGPRGFGQRGHGRNEILGVAGGPDATVTDVVVVGPRGMVFPPEL